MTRVHSAAGCLLPDGVLVSHPPFRAPHHSASLVALVGGGSWSLRPGEISLATHGVLFLDEMGEFPVAALEALRQPLEEGVIRVSRAGGTVAFPAQFLLAAAMNPCPCGEGVFEGACRCTDADRARYTRRLSAPLLDRFDLVVPAGPSGPRPAVGGHPRRVHRGLRRPGGRRPFPRRRTGTAPATAIRRCSRRRPGCWRPSCAREPSPHGVCTRWRGWRARWPTWSEPSRSTRSTSAMPCACAPPARS